MNGWMREGEEEREREREKRTDRQTDRQIAFTANTLHAHQTSNTSIQFNSYKYCS